MTKEHSLQNQIRNELAGQALIFRANVGQAWTGSAKRLPSGAVLPAYERLPNGDLLVHNPRPFSTGLPPGFSDLFGLVSVTITPDMVGQKLAVFTALEVKAPRGKPTENQTNFLQAVNDNGGRAGVVRTVEEAVRIALNR